MKTSTEMDIVTKMVERLESVLKGYGYQFSEKIVYDDNLLGEITEFVFLNARKEIFYSFTYFPHGENRYDQFNVSLHTKSATHFSFDRFYSLHGPKENSRYFIRIPEELTLEEYVDQFYHFAVEAMATDGEG